jgi:A/G-specific adenine glycosylase
MENPGCPPHGVAFSQSLLNWFDLHGRKDLPWKQDPTPYRVWVSEIMLQQTQVATVIPYYQRFIQRFPDLSALAHAPVDEVLGLWTGLGYYARARNLHRTAQLVCEIHGGQLPTTLEALIELPGIGCSTAGAILALALGQRHPILDGNAKRVLTRQEAIGNWPGQPRVERQLWQRAGELLPMTRVADYTQAIMDLGATICTRRHPRCPCCPVKETCRAYAQGNPEAYPRPRPRKRLPLRVTLMLILLNNRGEVLLERRPPTGIWGGLWSFPECAPQTEVTLWCREHLGCHIGDIKIWPLLRHYFTHFTLDIEPVVAWLQREECQVMEPNGWVWYKIGTIHERGLPAPTLRLLEQLHQELEGK